MNGRPRASAPPFRTPIAAAAYVAAAIVFTWPLAFHLRTLFGAADPTGDPSLTLWTLGWDLRTLSTHPLWLLNGRVFDANIFFPARHTLAYSDHLLLQATALWPVWAATHDLVLCYNLLLLGSLVASALVMHGVARRLVGSEPAAYVAGLVFGFAPYHFTHLTHIQLQALYFLPLSFLLLHRVFERRRTLDAVALGGTMGLQFVSSAYYGIIGALGVGCAALVLAIAGRRFSDWNLVRRGLTAAAVAALVAVPWSLPYLAAQRETGAGRNLFEAAQASAVPASYLQAPPTNVIYGRTGFLAPGPGGVLPRKDGPEQALFPGFVPMALALAGCLVVLLGGRRAAEAVGQDDVGPMPPRVLVAICLVVGVAGFVLSLGPDGVRPVYAGLYHVFFGMEAIRASARFSVLVLFAIALLAAQGVAALTPRVPFLAVAAVAAIAVEFFNGAIAFPAPPILETPAGAWLRAQPGSGAVVCLPIGLDRENTPCMLQSLEHGRPIVNGYSGIRPPFLGAVVETLGGMPSSDALLALRDLDVEFVVSAKPVRLPDPVAGALLERASFGDERIYQVAWSPEILARLTADVEPAPRDPGVPGFGPGESATYQVRWTSGPMNVPAGEMTVGVAPPRGREAFRFTASAKTAPWVARFFETTAVLETTTDAQLLPILHVETIDDGKRRVERQLSFDFPGHHVQMTGGGSAVTLPLAAQARDPVSALFYVRTLPLEAGRTFSLPLTDNGRPSRLEVSVGAIETIQAAGTSWRVWKVEPRIRQRIERQAPLTMTTWVSADDRRLPVRIDIEAGFGAVRADLGSYRAY